MGLFWYIFFAATLYFIYKYFNGTLNFQENSATIYSLLAIAFLAWILF